MGRLRTTVHVHTPDAGVVVYGPDDTVPAKHAKLITNPKVWASDESSDDPAPQAPDPKA